MPIVFSTAKFTPNSLRVVAGLRSRSPGETLSHVDKQWPPKSCRRILQRATDSCGDGAKAWNELGKYLRCKRLVAITFSHFRRIVYFDHQRISSCCDCGQTH